MPALLKSPSCFHDLVLKYLSPEIQSSGTPKATLVTLGLMSFFEFGVPGHLALRVGLTFLVVFCLLSCMTDNLAPT